MNADKFVRKNIAALEPYSTARDDYQGGIGIFLDANESPFGWGEGPLGGVNRYPDPRQRALKSAVSALKGVPPESIFIGNGSDEAIDLCYRIFCDPGKDNCVGISPSYGMYQVCAEINDVEYRPVLLNEDFSLPLGRLLEACDENTKLIFVCSPNNPTSNAFPLSQLKTLHDSFGGILVVDEAYADFSSQGTMLSILDSCPRMIVLQTLSKAWGMAALRVGLGFMSPEFARYFSMVKYPYNISGPVQESALELLGKGVEEKKAAILSERPRVSQALRGMKAVEKVYESDANFLLVKTSDPDRIYEELVRNGVIVRNRSRCPLCEGCLRITIGTPEENDIMLGIMEKFR